MNYYLNSFLQNYNYNSYQLNRNPQIFNTGKVSPVDENPLHEEAQSYWVNDVENRQQEDAGCTWRHLGVSCQRPDQAAEAEAG